MALPQVQNPGGLPTPQLFSGLPQSPQLSDPLYGVNPFDGSTAYGQQFGLGASGTTPAGFNQTAMGQEMIARQMQMLAQAGVPLDSDPNEWGLDEATAQTDSALAKIATVNPDLAQQLQSRREGQPPPDDGGGFWDDLKGAVGTLVHPFAAIGGTALEVLGRSANVIPGMLNADDDDPFWEDAWQSVTGQQHTHWNEVLQSWGWDADGGVSGFMRATVGFGLDVATDPLTYATFGTAGVGRKVAAATAEKVAATTIGKDVLLKAGVGLSDDAATAAVEGIWRKFTSAGGAKVMDVDAAAAVLGEGAKDAERLAAAEMWRAADIAGKGVASGNLRKFATPFGEQGEAVVGALEGRIGELGRVTTSKATYGTVRELQAGLGGVRFRFSLPGIHMTSAAIPGTAGYSFQFARRFFAGQSGLYRLGTAIKKGADGVGTDDMMRWMEGGYEAAVKANPKLAVIGTGRNLGGGLYSVSDQLGKITASMSPGARMLRAGFTGRVAHEGALAARNLQNEEIHQAYTWVDAVSGETMAPDKFHQYLGETLGSATTEQQAQFRTLLETMPNAEAAKDPRAWLSRETSALRAQEAAGNMTPEEATTALQELTKAADDAMAAKQAIGDPRMEEALFRLRGKVDEIGDRAARDDIAFADEWDTDLDGARVLADDDAADWARHGHSAGRDHTFYSTREEALQPDDIRHRGFDDSHKVGSGLDDAGEPRRLGHGITGEADAQGRPLGDPERTVAMRVRLKKPLVVDQRIGVGAVGPEQGILDEAYAAADQAAEAGRAAQELGAVVPERQWQDIRTAQADEMATAVLEKQGYDSIVTISPDGHRAVTVFDPKQAKAVVDTAPRAIRGRGYFPRTFSEEFETFLNGTPRGQVDELDKFIYGEPKLMHDMRRKYRGLTQAEAQDEVIKELTDRGIKVPPGMKVYDDDILSSYKRYVGRHAKVRAHEELGQTWERIAHYGDLGARYNANPTLVTPYKYVPSDRLGAKAKSLENRIMHQSHAAAKAQNRMLEESMRVANRNAKHWAGIRTALLDPDSLDDEVEGVARLAGAEGRVVGSTRVAGATLREEMVRAKYEIARLKKAIPKIPEDDIARGTQAGMDLEAAQKRLVGLEEQYRALPPVEPRTPVARRDITTGEVTAPTPRSTPKLAQERAARVARDQALEKKIAVQVKRERKYQHYVERLQSDVDAANGELNKLYAQARTLGADMKPAFQRVEQGTPPGWTRISVRGFEDQVAPAFIAQEFERTMKNFADVSDLRKHWRGLQGIWKRWATFRNPGFHVRNNEGAAFNNWLGGVGHDDYEMATQILKAKGYFGDGVRKNMLGRAIDPKLVQKYNLHKAIGANPTWADLDSLLGRWGVHRANSIQFSGVMTTLEEMSKNLDKPRGVGAKILAGYDKPMKWAGGATEDGHRAAAFLNGLKTMDGDPFAAHAHTMMRHGDYEDLNDFENFIKDLVPFYKWTRTNVPLQFHQLLEAPGKQLGVIKAKNALYNAQGYDQDEMEGKIPDYQRNAFSIPMPGGSNDGWTAMILDLPMADLYKGTTAYTSSFLPLIMPAIESYALHKDTFTGKEYTGKKVPLAFPFDIPILGDALGSTLGAAGMMERGADGKWMIDDKFENLLTTIPVYSRFRNFVNADPERQSKRASALWSFFTGTQQERFDEDDFTDNEVNFYYGTVEPTIEQFRSMGVQFPDKDEIDPYVFTALGLTPPAEAA